MSLKSGAFVAKDGRRFNIYKVEVGSYTRLDFVDVGAQFQVEPEAVRYSRIVSNGVHTYGDSSIYEDYLELMGMLQTHYDDVTTKQDWVQGSFMQETIKECKSKKLVYRLIFQNGVLNSEDAICGGRGYTLSMQLDNYKIKLNPINWSQYQTVTLGNSSMQNKSALPYYTLDVLKQKYDLRHIESMDFVVVDGDDIELAEKRLTYWASSPCVLKGIDTETTGIDVCKVGEDWLVGIILGIGTTWATYFPVRMETFTNLPRSFIDHLMEIVKAHEEHLVWFNGKFDRQVFLKDGYDIKAKWDAMILDILVNPIVNVKGAHALKTIVDEILNLHFLELKEIYIDPTTINFAKLPKDIVKYYACPDVTNTVVVFEDRWKKLPKDTRKLYEYECYLVNEKANEEFYGIRVDVEQYIKNHENCDYVVDKLLNLFRYMTHEDGNINSYDVISTLIYDKMHCPVVARTKTGRRSTASAAITKLSKMKAHSPVPNIENVYDLIGERMLANGAKPADVKSHCIIKGEDLGAAKYPALLVLDKYKEFNKRKTAFYSRFERTVRTGRIYFWVNQYGAASGRQSSPMHQLPPELKKVIIQDGDDWNLFGADFGQVELRMMAYNADEPELIELARNPKNDIHRIIGSLISGKEMYEISPEERNIGKRRNFGVIYLISKYGLAGQLYGAGYSKDQVEFAGQQLDAFFNRFKRIKRYIARNKHKILTTGQIRTIMGRTRYFPEVFDPDTSSKRLASIIRQGNNMPVQGSAADLMKIAECNFSVYIQQHGWDKLIDGYPMVRVMLSIHDEVLISAHKSIALEEIIKMIRDCMEVEIKGAPPFFVQPALMDSWGDHTNDALAMPIELRDHIIDEYLKTGVSKLNTENYVEVLAKYRRKCIDDYMHGLIAKYGDDYRIVGDHVRDGALTFELLDLYDKQLKPLKLTHKENIIEATRMYMEGVEAIASTSTEDDVEDTVEYQSIEALVNFDAEGNVIFEDADEEDEDISYMITEEDVKYINEIEQKYLYAWELADTIVLDCAQLKDAQINKILEDVYEENVSTGFFKVKLLFDEQLYDSTLRVEDLDIDAYSEKIASYVNSNASLV